MLFTCIYNLFFKKNIKKVSSEDSLVSTISTASTVDLRSPYSKVCV